MEDNVIGDYEKKRDRILRQERELFLGENLHLSEEESILNDVLLKLKSAELKLGYNGCDFLASKHFFTSKNDIDQNDIFKIIKKLPKGGCLHTHMLAAVSVDFVVNDITYRNNLYGKMVDDVFKLQFFKPDCDNVGWTSLKVMREKDENFDNWLRDKLCLVVKNPKQYKSIENIWDKFKNIFTIPFDMLCYKPVFEDYIYQLLLESYEDKIFYVELRGAFMELYDLNTTYPLLEYFKTLHDVVQKFKSQHDDFVDLKYIHSVFRGVSNEELKKNIDELIEMKKIFPDLIAGLDLVGFEDDGKTLLYFHKELRNSDLTLYLHAGETNWFGHTDLNLADAVLLNSKRLGHAYALTKHPKLMDMVKNKDIAIEVSPISNQVLMLVDDLRNHPLVGLMARGFPIVICNDDPSAWDASGLSYDWYVTFMAMTPSGVGLKFFKQIAMNSIKYSALSDEAKISAMKLWESKWNKSVKEILDTLK